MGKRIAELEAGEEIAAKDVRALLTDEQMARLDAECKNQEQLRKGQRARTEEQKRALGWKTKREVRLEAFRQALAEANGSMLTTLNELQQKSMVRQTRVYLDTYGAAINEGREKQQAKTMANNALSTPKKHRLSYVLHCTVSAVFVQRVYNHIKKTVQSGEPHKCWCPGPESNRHALRRGILR